MTDIDFRNQSKLLALQSLGFRIVHIDSMRQYRLLNKAYMFSTSVREKSGGGKRGTGSRGGRGDTAASKLGEGVQSRSDI